MNVGSCGLEGRSRGTRNWIAEESGQSILVMFLIVLPVLLLTLGVLHDLGNAAVAATIGQNAADLAAAEAGKLVDVDHFAQWQEVRLRPEAALVAQQVASDLTNGAFQVDGVYIVDGNLVVVDGRVTALTPFLEVFLGRRSITRSVQGVARTAHGVEVEGE